MSTCETAPHNGGQPIPERSYPIKTWEDVHQETWRLVKAVKEALIELEVAPDSQLTSDSPEESAQILAWETPAHYSAGEKICIGEEGSVYLVAQSDEDAAGDKLLTITRSFTPDEFLAEEVHSHYGSIRLATYYLSSKVHRLRMQAAE